MIDAPSQVKKGIKNSLPKTDKTPSKRGSHVIYWPIYFVTRYNLIYK